MKRLFSIILFLLFTSGYANAQYAVKGVVIDTLNYTRLYRSSVVLMRAKDSVIENFGRAAVDGSFNLNASKPGKYILKIMYRGFADYVDAVTVTKPETDLGSITMISKERLLKEFVITRQVAAIKIKGDTTEYVADSFKTRENATVEDLLKRLPGIQVDKNGQIVAQGETVAKILVDGEEFFSDDPKVITKGLQAKAVDKVQVFDKKSDQAEFTGIDDGQKTKTINLELKEEYKKGYFGKVDAGGGTDGYFQNQAMINAFKSKRQFSAFGIASNTDKIGLGWQDNDKFGAGNGVTEISEDGEMVTTFNNDGNDFGGWNGKYNGQGLPKTWTGGVHYADKWNEGRSHVTGNYRYAQQNVELDGENVTQTGLRGDTSLINDQTRSQFSKGTRNAVDGMYEWKIDTNTTIKLTANAGTKTSETYSHYFNKSILRAGDLLDTFSTNNRTITSTSDAWFINADLLLRKKFSKKGRTLSVDVKENAKDNNSNGHLNSLTNGPVISTVDQRKVNASNTLAFSGKATYTEPLSKVAYLEVDYGITLNNSTSKIYSYDRPTGTGAYDMLNDTFSSNYKYNILSNTGGVNFKFVYKKVNFSFGSDVSNTGYLQTDLLHGDTSHRYSYVNLFPKANFTYKIGKQTSFNFLYQGSTQQPTISQIQPLRQNNDPQNITLGNPGLRQEFINKGTLRFNDYKILSNRYLWSSLSFSTINDAISTADSIVGSVRTTKYINVDGNYSGNGYVGYGFKIKKIDLDMGLQVNGAINHVNNVINGVYNTSNYNSYSFGPYFQYEKDNKIELSWNPELTFNVNKSTNNTLSTDYKVFSSEVRADVQLPLKFEFNTSFDIMIREKTAVFTSNNNVVKWNAYVAKKFLKKSELELRLSVFDILNQNIGFSRDAQANIITQSSYNTIRRYGMINLIWNFTHTPSGSAPPSEGPMMMMR